MIFLNVAKLVTKTIVPLFAGGLYAVALVLEMLYIVCIYGFVRFADENEFDFFHGYDKESLITEFED
jgi:hypothetical protein